MDVNDVLTDMDEVANATTEATFRQASPQRVQRWLDVLRPILARDQSWVPAAPQPDVERIPIKSGLPQRLLRDLEVVVTLRADHEGTGEVEFNYARVPMEHRLQALLSVNGVVGDRIELAMGTEAYVNLLRGVIARRER